MTVTVSKLLGAALLLDLCIIGLLAVLERPIPDVLPGALLAGLTGLLGTLAPSPREQQILQATAPRLEQRLAARHAAATTTTTTTEKGTP